MENEDREQPSSPSSDGGDSTSKRCENCGTAIDTGEWYPVTKERDADGSLRLHSFCDEDCQEAWLDERPE